MADDPQKFANKPLAGLAALRAQLPPGPAPAEGASPAPGAAPTSGEPGAKIVLRRERKKRGGKTVTRIEGLELADEALFALSKKLTRALGCGGSREGGDLLLQGDHVARGARWLRDQGYARVIEGN